MILLPPEMDGVAYFNAIPILAGQSHSFRFKIRQHGTYWYHSHTKLQKQMGLYGAIVIHPQQKNIGYDRDLVVVLSYWSDENADDILSHLRKDGDYCLYKKKNQFARYSEQSRLVHSKISEAKNGCGWEG